MIREPLVRLLGGPAFARALTVAIVGTAALTPTVVALIGWAGLIAVIAGEVLLAVGSLIARDERIRWATALPYSLLVFVALAALSAAWAQSQRATLESVAYLVAFTVLGAYVAIARDLIQVIRAFGDVSRAALGASLVVEIVAGVLIDSPIPFLGVAGRLGVLGPIQGLLHDSNQLGLFAIVAVVGFVVEARTRSVPSGVAAASIAVGVLVILLTRSSVVLGTAVVVALAAAALYVIRRARPAARRDIQYALLGTGVVTAVVAWVLRSPIIVALDAVDALTSRLSVWQQVMGLTDQRQVEGWGWIGQWRREMFPFSVIRSPDIPVDSARSAWVDVWFQLGLFGLAVFVAIVALAFARAWLLAGRKRSVIYAWPALVLCALIVFSFAESSILVDFGWLVFVVCAVKAGQEISWRKALQ